MSSQPQTQDEVLHATRNAVANSLSVVVRTPSTLSVSLMGSNMRSIWENASRLAALTNSGGYMDGYTIPGALRVTTDRHLMESRSDLSTSLMSHIWECARGQR